MRRQCTRRVSRRDGVRSGSLAVAVITTLAGAGIVTASTPNRYDNYIGTGIGNWFDAANWDAGVPLSSDNARIIGSPTVNINGDAVGGLIAFGSDNQNPFINLGTGASLTSFGGITFGGNGGNVGGTNVTTFTQTGGAVTVEGPGLADTIIIGNGGNAVYNMSGGTMRISGPDWVNPGFLGLTVGGSIGGTSLASGTLNLSGGTIYTDQLFQVARGGANGTVNMTGGTINAGINVWMGSFGTTGGKATINQSGGTLNVGYNASGTNPGTFDNDGNH